MSAHEVVIKNPSPPHQTHTYALSIIISLGHRA